MGIEWQGDVHFLLFYFSAQRQGRQYEVLISCVLRQHRAPIVGLSPKREESEDQVHTVFCTRPESEVI